MKMKIEIYFDKKYIDKNMNRKIWAKNSFKNWFHFIK